MSEDNPIKNPKFVSKFDTTVAEPRLDATPRKATEPEDQAAYDEYFARGGKVTVYDVMIELKT